MSILFTGHSTTLLRNLVLNNLIKFGAEYFTNDLREKFKRHCDGTDIISPDQRNIVFRSVLASDGKQVFDELIKVSVSFPSLIASLSGKILVSKYSSFYRFFR